MDFQNSNDLINLEGMLINYDFRQKIVDNKVSNKVIMNYYNTLRAEYDVNPKMSHCIGNKLQRLQDCNKYWELDYYKNQRVKVYKKTEYCKDKFCLNCKKWRQAVRMKKFLPELMKYDDDLYFVTYTVPNVNAIDVKETIKKVFEAHRQMVQYLMGHKKSKLLNLPEIFNFIGGIRVLEISINRDRKNKYHVHIHCAYILKEYSPSTPKYVNKYSIDHTGRRNYVRKFTHEEILLQKFWYLLYEKISFKDCYSIHQFRAFNKNTNMERDFNNFGYSVTIDKFKPGQYQEMFKYIIKDKALYTDSNGDLKDDLISYDEFKTLYFATANVRQIETYGVLKDIEDAEDIIDSQEVDEMFSIVQDYLNSHEAPEPLYEPPEHSLLSDSIYLSKNKLFTYYRKLILEEEASSKGIRDADNKVDIEEFKFYNYIIRGMLDLEKRRLSLKEKLTSKVIEVIDI